MAIENIGDQVDRMLIVSTTLWCCFVTPHLPYDINLEPVSSINHVGHVLMLV